MPGPTPSYTIDEANALLPEVRAVLLQLAVEQRKLEAAVTAGLPETNGNPDDPTRARRHEAAVSAIADGMRALLAHLDELGVQLRDLEAGLVDFPGQRDGETVWLCWRLADPRVAFWHTTSEGFASRKPW